jgi:UDP-glucuronate 4-epimerase
MALFLFSAAILAGKPIQVFNHGRMRRDFTYIDDVVEGVLRVAARPPQRSLDPDAAEGRPTGTGAVPFRLYNIGNHQPVELNELIRLLEACLGRHAVREDLPMQPGDVLATFADVEKLARDTGFRPTTPIAEGVARFVSWYREYYGV